MIKEILSIYKKNINIILQFFSDGLFASSTLIIFALERYFNSNSSQTIGEFVIFLTTVSVVSVISSLGRETVFLNFYSMGKKQTSYKNHIILSFYSFLILIISLLLTLIFNNLFFLIGALHSYTISEINILRYVEKIKNYCFLKITFPVLMFIFYFFFNSDEYNSIILSYSISISILFFLVNPFRKLRIYFTYRNKLNVSSLKSISSIVSYRLSSVILNMLEYRLLGATFGIATVSSVGFLKEILRVFGFIVQGYNRISAVKISTEYYKNKKIKNIRNSRTINLIGFSLLLLISIYFQSKLFFILSIISFLENIQHLQSYWFFVKEKVNSLTALYLITGIGCLYFQSQADSDFIFYSIRMISILVLTLLSYLLIKNEKQKI